MDGPHRIEVIALAYLPGRQLRYVQSGLPRAHQFAECAHGILGGVAVIAPLHFAHVGRTVSVVLVKGQLLGILVPGTSQGHNAAALIDAASLGPQVLELEAGIECHGERPLPRIEHPFQAHFGYEVKGILQHLGRALFEVDRVQVAHQLRGMLGGSIECGHYNVCAHKIVGHGCIGAGAEREATARRCHHGVQLVIGGRGLALVPEYPIALHVVAQARALELGEAHAPPLAHHARFSHHVDGKPGRVYIGVAAQPPAEPREKGVDIALGIVHFIGCQGRGGGTYQSVVPFTAALFVATVVAHALQRLLGKYQSVPYHQCGLARIVQDGKGNGLALTFCQHLYLVPGQPGRKTVHIECKIMAHDYWYII